MVLTVWERVTLLLSLPAEGDLLSLRIVRRLREALSFAEDEQALFKFEQSGEQTRWRGDVPQEADIPIGAKATEIVRRQLKELVDQLDKQGKLTEMYLGMCAKFGLTFDEPLEE